MGFPSPFPRRLQRPAPPFWELSTSKYHGVDHVYKLRWATLNECKVRQLLSHCILHHLRHQLLLNTLPLGDRCVIGKLPWYCVLVFCGNWRPLFHTCSYCLSLRRGKSGRLGYLLLFGSILDTCQWRVVCIRLG